MNGTNTHISEYYRLDTVIGNGGMGIVYRGTDTRTGEPIAIKQLKSSAVDQSASMVARFEREAEALRRLDHPNIVKVLDTVKVDETHYIIMEYVPGGTLRTLLDRGDSIPMQRALTIMLELADALTRAHHLGIVHRDLKPGNVLLADDGTPRLTDFGVARMENRERLTDEDMSVGTLDYIAPEVLEGNDNDKRSDVWSFGVMMYEILTGQQPFAAATTAGTVAAILAREPDDVRMINPEIPQGLAYLIEGMMVRERGFRINSVRQVGAELESVLQEEDQLPTTIRRFRTPVPPPTDALSTPVMGISTKNKAAIPGMPATDPVTRQIHTRKNRDGLMTKIALVIFASVLLAFIIGTNVIDTGDRLAPLDETSDQPIAAINAEDSPALGIDSNQPLNAVAVTAQPDELGRMTYSNDLYSLRAPAAWSSLDINNTLTMLDRVTDGSDTFTNIIGEPDKLDIIAANLLSAEGVAVRREQLPTGFTTQDLVGWVPFMLAEINLPIRPNSEQLIETQAGSMVRVELGVEDDFIGPDNFQVYFMVDSSILYWIIFYTPEDSFDHLTEDIERVLDSFTLVE